MTKIRKRSIAKDKIRRKQPSIAVDCIVFDSINRLLLIRRAKKPFIGKFALPGGFLEYGETVEAAARRELEEETGLRIGALKLVGVYSNPKRDPRKHVISIAYATKVASPLDLRAGDDASDAEWVSGWENLDLAFDHNNIVTDAQGLIQLLFPMN